MLKNVKILLVLAPLMMAGISSFSQDNDYSNYLLQRLEEFKGESHIQSNSKIAGHNHRKCLSLLLNEVRKNYYKLNTEAQTAFKTLVTTRVDFSGPELTYSNGVYKYHYTNSGIDKVPSADANSNGTPDYVESMANVFNTVYQKEITNLGYFMPPSDLNNNDGDNGGDGNYDVYIVNIADEIKIPYVYGYASSEGNLVDNPNTTFMVETQAAPSIMVMNNDYSWVNSGITVLEAIEVTAAHEFFHAIQYGICRYNSDFFAESTAAWMEDIVYPGIDDNLQYIGSNFANPDVALDINDQDYYYGAWTFWRYLSDRYTPDVVKKIWFRANDEFEHDAFNNELNARGSSFESEVINWQVANQVMTSNSAFSPFTYARATDYGNYLKSITSNTRNNIKKEKSYTYTGSPISHYSLSNGNGKLMRLAADYFTINSAQNFSVTLTPNDITQDLDLYIIKVNTSNNKFELIHANLTGGNYIASVTDASSYNSFTVMVSRYDEAEIDGASADYTLGIGTVITGIAKEAIAENAKVYPNPTSREFVLEYSTSNAASVEVADYSGKSVYSSNLDINFNGKHLVDSSSWPAGIYILSIKGENGVISRNRIAVVK